ncbi:MAG TPA: hypothetical protein VFU48_11595 [Nitrospira sp.]|nr:hypothetical protein [Nitrospira sp.]
MMLLVMRGRNDSIVYHTTRWDISGGTGLASQLQSDATRVTSDHAFPSGSPHLAQGVADARTGQFGLVAGDGIDQHHGAFPSFVAKMRFEEDPPSTSIAGTRTD